MSSTKRKKDNDAPLSEALKMLTPDQVLEVDRALASIGPFGEVRLVKVKGKVRFIQKLKSNDLLQLCRSHGRGG